MADVTLSSAVRTNLLSLQNTSTLLEETQTRLATGLRVNSALDDPSAFFTSSSLNSRAGDLNRLLDSVGLAIQTVEAADDGIQAITDLVEAAQASARNALQAASAVTTAASTTGTIGVSISDVAATTSTTAGLTGDTAAALTGSVTGVFNSTDLNTDLSLGGANQDLTISVDGGAAVTITIGTAVGADTNSGSGLAGLIEAQLGVGTVTDGGTNALQVTAADADTTFQFGGAAAATLGLATTLQSPTNLLSQGIAQGETLTIQIGSNAATTITFGTNDGANEVSTIAELQTALTTSTVAGSSTVTVGSTGDITLTATSNSDAISITGNTGAVFGFASDAVTVNPTAASLVNNGIVADDDTFSIVVGGTTTTLTFGTGNGEINTLTELDTQLEAITGITSSVDSNGFLTIAASDTTTSFTLTDGTNTPLASAFGITPASFSPTTTNNVTRAAAEAEFNNLLTQIDQLAADASFNGNNLLAGDNLTVIFNEDGSSSLSIAGVNFDSTGLGISAAATDSFQTDSNINSTLAQLDTAITSLQTQAATFGSNLSVVQIRQDFTKNLINTLETGAANLTLADSNEEAANLLALQTRQSLSSSSLSLAARGDQNVLQLLR